MIFSIFSRKLMHKLDTVPEHIWYLMPHNSDEHVVLSLARRISSLRKLDVYVATSN